MTMAFRKKPGYTLIEVLIASTIFASVMILAMGTFAQAGNYQSKLKQTRQTASDVRRITDQLTRDIREAKDDSQVTTRLGSGYLSYTYNRGVVLASCTGTPFVCDPISNIAVNTNFGASDPVANTIILIADGKYKLYFSYLPAGSVDKYSLYYKTGLVSEINNRTLSGVTWGMRIPENKLHQGNETSVKLALVGYAPDKTSAVDQQPFIKFRVESKTYDYYNQKIPLSSKAEAMIESTVTLRNYK